VSRSDGGDCSLTLHHCKCSSEDASFLLTMVRGLLCTGPLIKHSAQQQIPRLPRSQLHIRYVDFPSAASVSDRKVLLLTNEFNSGEGLCSHSGPVSSTQAVCDSAANDCPGDPWEGTCGCLSGRSSARTGRPNTGLDEDALRFCIIAPPVIQGSACVPIPVLTGGLFHSSEANEPGEGATDLIPTTSCRLG
jgi:hypothetical protein